VGCDYRFEADVQLLQGSGYGLVVRAAVDAAGTLSGRGLQYDVGVGGLRDVFYPNHSEDGPVIPHPTDAAWHHISVSVIGTSYLSSIDGQTAFTGSTASGCGDLVVRLWRSSINLRNLTVRKATDLVP
jgi:hypothetical protein